MVQQPSQDANSIQSILEDIVRFLHNSDSKLAQLIRNSLTLIEDFIEKEKQICFSYNGGKDSTVLLYLVLAAYYVKYNSEFCAYCRKQVVFVFFRTSELFSEMEQYISQQNAYFELGLKIYEDVSLAGALKHFLQDYQKIQSTFIGIRQVDGQQTRSVEVSTPNYPRIVRVSPILDYDLVDIWEFLLRFGIKYCDLYDVGYTSIGPKDRTYPNEFINTPGRKICDQLVENGVDQGRLRNLVEKCQNHSIMLPIAMLNTERRWRQ